MRRTGKPEPKVPSSPLVSSWRRVSRLDLPAAAAAAAAGPRKDQPEADG